MTLLVYMRDGRSVYRIKGRAQLAKLVSREPFHEESGIVADRGTWNPVAGEFVWLPGVRLRFLAKGSIGHVEQDTDSETVSA